MKFTLLPPHAPRRISWVGATLRVLSALALCGLVDWATGYEVSVFVIYVVPIGLSMRFFGLRGGVIAALMCAVVWGVADVASGHPYSGPWVVYWNGLNRLVFFVCFVMGLQYIQDTQAVSRRRMKAYSGLLPVCTQCHRIGASDGVWQTAESFICEHEGAQPEAKVCPDCARQRYAASGSAQSVALP